MFLLFTIIKYLISLITFKPQQMWNMSHNYDTAVHFDQPTYKDGFGHTYHVKTGKMVWETTKTVGDEEHRVLLDSHTCLLVEDLTESYLKKLFEEEHEKISDCMYSSLKNRFNSRKNAINNNEKTFSFNEQIYYRANNKEHTNKNLCKSQRVIVNRERSYNTHHKEFYVLNSGYKENIIEKMNYIYSKEFSLDNNIYVNTKNALNNYYKTDYNISYEEFAELLSYYGIKTLYISNDISKQIYLAYIDNKILDKYNGKDEILKIYNIHPALIEEYKKKYTVRNY